MGRSRAVQPSVACTLRQTVLAMAFDTLVVPTVALVKVPIFGDRVIASVRHVVVVTDPLLLLVPTAIAMQSFRKVGPSLTVTFALAPFASTVVDFVVNLGGLFDGIIIINSFALVVVAGTLRTGQREKVKEHRS